MSAGAGGGGGGAVTNAVRSLGAAGGAINLATSPPDTAATTTAAAASWATETVTRRGCQAETCFVRIRPAEVTLAAIPGHRSVSTGRGESCALFAMATTRF